MPSKNSPLATALAPDLTAIPPDLVDKYVIAHTFSVSPRTIENWVAQRKIPFLDLGHRTMRFRIADVRRALDRKTVKEVS